jgi:serine/threonine protein kinase
MIELGSWPALSKLLDQWLDLPPESRAGWLESLGPEYDAILPALRTLLEAQPADTFLNTLPLLDGAAKPAAAGFAADMRVGPYRLIRELGRGGMGVVWLAERADGAFQIRVALKLSLGLWRARLFSHFARERDLLARLVHPHIARFYDAGIDQGQPYIALEYVEGEAITTHSDRRVLSIRQRLVLFLDVLRAVQYAHTNLVVHRDLKPSNILVSSDGEVRLLDFGIAKQITEGEARETELTRIGGRALTPDYASPEQITGEPVTTASDVYSLGVLLYELLTGERPYRLKRDTRASLEEAIVSADPIRPSQIQRTEEKARARSSTPKRLARLLEGDLDTIILKALHKQPSGRYATADAFAQDVERYLQGQAVLAQPESVWYRARKLVLRNKVAVSAAVAVVAALAVGLGVALWEVRVARTEQQRADTEAATAKAVTDFLQTDVLAQASPNTTSPASAPDPDLKVRTALDHAAARIGTRFEKQPLVEASVRQTIGQAYLDLGLYSEAQRHFERSLDLRRHALGERHPATLEALNNLADLYSEQGAYQQAEALYAVGLPIQRQLSGEEHPITLAMMSNLGLVYRREKKYAQAEPLYTKVLAVRQRVLGPEHPDTLFIMNNLAVLYTSEHKLEQAETLHTKVVELKMRVLGPEHPSTLVSMNSLAVLYREERKYAQAEELLTKVLGIRSRLLGEEHPHTLITMNFLAGIYASEGKLAQAQALYAKVLEMRLRVLGKDHPDTKDTIKRLEALRHGLNPAKTQISAK